MRILQAVFKKQTATLPTQYQRSASLSFVFYA